jgi:hypothetical protein
MSMLNVFIGYDPRQPLALTVLQNSIYRRASKPVRITPLVLSQLPMKRRGLTEFTFSRFLVPHLCHYAGQAVFLDADMLVLCDLHEVLDFAGTASVTLVKNARKFEWPSLMVFNNGACLRLKPEWLEDETNNPYAFSWGTVGDMPSAYNHCVGYDKPRGDAKIVHYTQGIPCFPETRDCEYSDEWVEECRNATFTVPWKDLMGTSVHAPRVQRHLSEAAHEERSEGFV